MKRTVLIFYILFSMGALHAQKKLSELRVTLDSTAFEEVSSSSLPSLIEQEKQKGELFKRFYDIYRPRNSEYNRIYRLKETGELIAVTSRLNKQYREDWDKVVAMNIAMFASEEYGRESYVEHLNEKTYRAVIFFIKGNRKVTNDIIYKNPEKDAVLSVIYISDQPDEVKVENLRKIVKGLRID